MHLKNGAAFENFWKFWLQVARVLKINIFFLMYVIEFLKNWRVLQLTVTLSFWC